MSLTIDKPLIIELIGGFEGFVDGVYNDSRGFATCGYGHLLHQSPATADDHRRYDGRGRAFFDGLFMADIERVALGPMRSMIRVDLNAHQTAAVASGCFNCGPGFVYGSVGRYINAGKLQAAADAFLAWSNPPVLRPRRVAERRLFLSPVPHLALPWCTADERRWCLEYDRLAHAHKDAHRRRVLRRTMAAEAAKIQYAARHEGGWDRANRRHRYHSLVARCT